MLRYVESFYEVVKQCIVQTFVITLLFKCMIETLSDVLKVSPPAACEAWDAGAVSPPQPITADTFISTLDIFATLQRRVVPPG